MEPHDLLSAWNSDPLILTALLTAVGLYVKARPPARDRRRRYCFFAAVGVVTIALVSPLDAASEALASAHMIQHLLLISVAAPLLVLSAPTSSLLRGGPAALRRLSRVSRRRLGLNVSRLRALRAPALAWLAAVATLWFWHAAGLYELALRHSVVHAVSHLSYLASGLLFWSVVLGAGRAGRPARGFAVLFLFGMGLQATLLAALMTFSSKPWYQSYLTTTEAWGLDPLADQQVAGLLMWFPTGLLYAAVALWQLMRWIEESSDGAPAPEQQNGSGPVDLVGRT